MLEEAYLRVLSSVLVAEASKVDSVLSRIHNILFARWSLALGGRVETVLLESKSSACMTALFSGVLE